MIYGDVGIGVEVLECGILAEFRIIIDHANYLSIRYFRSLQYRAPNAKSVSERIWQRSRHVRANPAHRSHAFVSPFLTCQEVESFPKDITRDKRLTMRDLIRSSRCEI